MPTDLNIDTLQFSIATLGNSSSRLVVRASAAIHNEWVNIQLVKRACVIYLSKISLYTEDW